MISEETKVRVRYSETDQMGFVYYGNYAQYFELGRVAAMKKVGISYRALEESGVAMPVRDLYINYRKAAKYDDELRICCEIREMPSSKMLFHYRILREETLLVEGSTTLFFMDIEKQKVCKAPDELLKKLSDYFN